MLSEIEGIYFMIDDSFNGVVVYEACRIALRVKHATK